MMNKIVREFKQEPITVLTSIAHERYESNLAKLPYNFVVWDYPNSKPWHQHFNTIPDNHRYFRNLTSDIKFDCVLSQNKFGQFQKLSQIAKAYRVPHIVLEHTTCGNDWPKERIIQCFQMQGDANVFITEFSAKQWGFRDNYHVVNHMVDQKRFFPTEGKKNEAVLSVCNDLKARDRECGYRLWEAITHNTDRYLMGTCKDGIGVPAKNTEDLIKTIQKHKIFLNTSLISPLPMSLLEAMACGLVVVSTNTCQIPTVIKDGENGFMYDPKDPEHAKHIIQTLKNSSEEYLLEIGQNAVKTITEKFNETNFVNTWRGIIESVCN